MEGSRRARYQVTKARCRPGPHPNSRIRWRARRLTMISLSVRMSHRCLGSSRDLQIAPTVVRTRRISPTYSQVLARTRSSLPDLGRMRLFPNCKRPPCHAQTFTSLMSSRKKGTRCVRDCSVIVTLTDHVAFVPGSSHTAAQVNNAPSPSDRSPFEQTLATDSPDPIAAGLLGETDCYELFEMSVVICLDTHIADEGQVLSSPQYDCHHSRSRFAYPIFLSRQIHLALHSGAHSDGQDYTAQGVHGLLGSRKQATGSSGGVWTLLPRDDPRDKPVDALEEAGRYHELAQDRIRNSYGPGVEAGSMGTEAFAEQ